MKLFIKITSFFTLVLLFSFVEISAQDQNILFVKANEYAAAKDYQQAVSNYQQLLKTGVESAEVEFNLANAYLNNNQIAEAILHYERAKMLAPKDDDILQNLRIANERIESDIVNQPTFFLSDGWNGLQMSASSGFWSFLFLLCLFIGVTGLILWQIGQDRTKRKQGFFVGVGTLLLAVLFFFLAMGKASLETDSRAGIIMATKTELHTAAEANSPILRELPEGLKVTLFDNINNWYKVKLANGEEGWLPAQAFEKI